MMLSPMTRRCAFLILFFGMPEICAADAAPPSLQNASEKSRELECSKKEGLLPGPAVPNRDVAKQIYIAIAKALYPSTWRKYPIIFVRDEGGKWGVGQRQSDKTKFFRDKNGTKMESVEIVGSGGALEMSIDKCDATVTMSFSR